MWVWVGVVCTSNSLLGVGRVEVVGVGVEGGMELLLHNNNNSSNSSGEQVEVVGMELLHNNHPVLDGEEGIRGDDELHTLTQSHVSSKEYHLTDITKYPTVTMRTKDCNTIIHCGRRQFPTAVLLLLSVVVDDCFVLCAYNSLQGFSP